MPDAINLARAAALLGISKTELVRRIQEGIYQKSYVVDDRNRTWFSLKALENIMGTDLSEERVHLTQQKIDRKRQEDWKAKSNPLPNLEKPKKEEPKKEAPPTSPYSGELFAEVARKLESGVAPLQIAIELKIHPNVFKVLLVDFEEIGAGLFLSRECLTTIYGGNPPKGLTSEAFVSSLQEQVRAHVRPYEERINYLVASLEKMRAAALSDADEERATHTPKEVSHGTA